MIMHPAAPISWLIAMFVLALTMLNYLFGFMKLDPVMSVVIYLFFTEFSKLVAEMTNNGKNSN